MRGLSAMPWVASARGKRVSIPSPAMAAAQRVAEEVLVTCRQLALLALRRRALPITPIRCTRKSVLIADIAAECDTLANRQRILAEVLAPWTMHELRSFLARLRGLGYMVAVGQQPRKPDLIAAIINTREYAARAPAVSKQMREDLCSSATAPAVTNPMMWHAAGNLQGVRKGICSSAGVAEQLGPCSEGTSQDPCSRKHVSSEDPGPAVEPPPCMALVALDSAAAPVKLQHKLFRRWSKKWARFTKKNERKCKLQRVMDELRKAWQDHRATETVGALRAGSGGQGVAWLARSYLLAAIAPRFAPGRSMVLRGTC